ncbi:MULTISPECIES: D-alanine--D-alanine ligase family protein [Enterococcus]|uniref:D-alanine--D-alanine ligase family protein n=1 Tax=Enterococcus TaxID=1350 RepID=UPI0010F8F10D|nr:MULTISPECIES: D-alanine--D-alanine ligase [Enterococcus]KAF1300926.1 D-alanine--D-alanine ligase [Enterococcus sp. JM9B]
MNIVVLAGGLSDEREVSLSSGSQIANALMANGHQVVLLDVYEGAADCKTFAEAFAQHRMEKYTHTIDEKAPDVAEMKKIQADLVGPNVISICKTSDLVFLALHGGIGENGQLQALFDMYSIAYTGSGYKSSLLAMDKKISKELLTYHGIKTAPWQILTKDSPVTIDGPVVVKPNDNGSSIGVEIVENQTDLADSLAAAFQYSETVLVEEKIEGREFSVGILGEQVLPIIELIPKEGFYDYKNKYQQGMTEEITPAVLSPELTEKMQACAWQVHQLLGLSVYSRVDFMLSRENEVYVIEANSLPGMTPHSLLPQEAQAAGISYQELCEKILQLSLEGVGRN